MRIAICYQTTKFSNQRSHLLPFYREIDCEVNNISFLEYNIPSAGGYRIFYDNNSTIWQAIPHLYPIIYMEKKQEQWETKGVAGDCLRVGHVIFPIQLINPIIFSCDQAALQMVFSVRLSVCPSVTPFWLCSHHRIIMKYSGVITNDQSKVHAKGQGQRSKVKVTKVTTQLNRFRTVTPVWIHIWWWNDAYSLMLLKGGALLFFTVIRQISRSHGSKNRRIWSKLGVSGL